MKNKKNINPFFRLFGLVIVLVSASIIIGIGLFYYIFSIPEPEGLSLATWPNRFTDNFSAWLEEENGEIIVENKGMEYLNEYDLWLQVIDENGQEVFSYHKPDSYPMHYSASQLMEFHTSDYDNKYTVFASNYESSEQTYSYIIGFPYAVGKYMIYYNGENISRLSPIFRIGIILILGIVFVFTLAYGLWLSKHLEKITRGIQNISQRTYVHLAEKGLFRDVYIVLNEMNTEIRHSDNLRKDTERVRREWITNITHDVKTPLSPIKGYAELLAENKISENSTIQEYGKIILKNADYAEKLINDLKLTYQFEAGVIPLSMQKIHLVRYIKELVIDIINDPAFSTRNIEFESVADDIVVHIDDKLFRRAIGNLIINALTHNPPETSVIICVERSGQDKVSIIVRDNGVGISDKEQSELFERYYRGTNTQEKPEGSGLGLAIAKQIILIHGGIITVKSKVNEGTEFTVSIPIKQ